MTGSTILTMVFVFNGAGDNDFKKPDPLEPAGKGGTTMTRLLFGVAIALLASSTTSARACDNNPAKNPKATHPQLKTPASVLALPRGPNDKPVAFEIVDGTSSTILMSERFILRGGSQSFGLDLSTFDMRLEEHGIAELRHAIDAHLQRGDEANALVSMESLIDRLRERRDRLSREHRQEPKKLGELEEAKHALGRAHLQLGLLHEVTHARGELARISSRSGTLSPTLIAAQEKLAENEKRLREARGK